MNFEEELCIVIISVIFSSIINIVINLLFRVADKRKKVKCAKVNLQLLARNMKIAIINKSIDDVNNTIELLRADYGVFSKNIEMKKDYLFLSDCFVFLKSDGYNITPERKERDLEKILNILARIDN